MEKNPPIIDRIHSFYTKKLYICITAILLLIVSLFLFDDDSCTKLELGLWLLVSSYMIVSLIQREKYYRSNPSLYYTTAFSLENKSKLAFFCLLICFSILLFVRDKSFLWIVCIVLLNIAVIRVSKTYPKRYDALMKALSDIRKIELITAVIAICQLLIAFPQLKNSFHSATSQDIATVVEYLEESKNSFYQLKLNPIPIPDSLLTGNVKQSIAYRNELYYKTKNLVDIETSGKDAVGNGLHYFTTDDFPTLNSKLIISHKDSTFILSLVNLLKTTLSTGEQIKRVGTFSQSILYSLKKVHAYYSMKDTLSYSIIMAHCPIYTMNEALLLAQNTSEITDSNLVNIENLIELTKVYRNTGRKEYQRKILKQCDRLKEQEIGCLISQYTFVEQLITMSIQAIKAIDAIIISEAYGIKYQSE